jgi:hypothetical protein
MDKDQLKNELTIEQVFDLVADLGGEPQMRDGYFMARTICHGGSHFKLWYWNNTHLFKCFSDCDDVFDIFGLVSKVKEHETGKEWPLPKAVSFVASYFGYSFQDLNFEDEDSRLALEDWRLFNEYDNITEEKEKKTVELKKYDPRILENLPQPRIIPWEEEGISAKVMKECGIRYDPSNLGIVIPHYDVDGNLIGIRERTVAKSEEDNGKYRPAVINGQMFNSPLGFSLYNLNNSKDNVRVIKKAVIFESEKATLLYRTYWPDSDISCACCGSSITSYQVQLLLSLGVEEIVVALDRQYKEIGDEEFHRWTKKLMNIHQKYSSMVKVSFVFDKEHNLGYKMAPVDAGPDIFMKLFNERIFLT